MRLILSVLSAILMSQQASAFVASNGLVVEAEGQNVFTVPYRGLSGDTDFWCAAGDYGLARGIRGNTRIYLAEAEGPSVSTQGRKAVQFTFDPQAAGVTPIQPRVSLSVRAVGDNMTVTAARQFCTGNFLAF